jgi:hypothetical protein
MWEKMALMAPGKRYLTNPSFLLVVQARARFKKLIDRELMCVVYLDVQVYRLRQRDGSIKRCIGLAQPVDDFHFVAVEQATCLQCLETGGSCVVIPQLHRAVLSTVGLFPEIV